MHLTAHVDPLTHKLILAGTSEEFAFLSRRFAALAPNGSLAIHDLPEIELLTPLSLVVSLDGGDRIIRQSENEYVWHLSSDSRLEVVEMIDVLAGLATRGHQYFNCHPADGVTIEMSIGEYDFTAQNTAAG